MRDVDRENDWLVLARKGDICGQWCDSDVHCEAWTAEMSAEEGFCGGN